MAKKGTEMQRVKWKRDVSGDSDADEACRARGLAPVANRRRAVIVAGLNDGAAEVGDYGCEPEGSGWGERVGPLTRSLPSTVNSRRSMFTTRSAEGRFGSAWV